MRLVMLLVVTGLLAGCASTQTGDVYTRQEAREEMIVEFGLVEDVRQVQIEGTASGVGTVSGAVVGGIAGSTVGGGRGSAIASVLGAVVGGAIGSSIEEDATKRVGVEITVRLESGGLRAYVQEATEEQFLVGERVRIVRNRGTVRVTH